VYEYLVTLPRNLKTVLLLFADLSFVVISMFIAFVLRLNMLWPIGWFSDSITLVYIMMVTLVVASFMKRLHLIKLSNIGSRFAADIGLVVFAVTFIGFLANIGLDLGAPRTTPLIAGLVLFIGMFLFRFIILSALRFLEFRNTNRIPIAIYGAGANGTQLASNLYNSKFYKAIAFVDDNPHLQGLDISGIRVYKPKKLKNLLEKGLIKEIFISDPLKTEDRRNTFLASLANLSCKIQEIPGYEEVIQSGDIVKSLRVVEPEELLGRTRVEIEGEEINSFYENNNIFVSGGGGSIGSELCRKIMKHKPHRLIIFDISEYNLYQIEKELRPLADKLDIELVALLGCVTNKEHLSRLFRMYEIRVVLHAAAYKHVPLVEANILQGIKNNFLGTKSIVETAAECGVNNFTLVSTDKAVRPTSIMGASKRLAEMVLQNISKTNNNCTFSMVRFGNVLGSSGSVVPVLKEQIENGGPVIITHKEVTRYFMTLNEAAHLVLMASLYAKGGDVFVLDMGKPVKIYDLAKNMIKLSGHTVRDENNPKGDIEIKVGKLRPGEKLFEELLVGENTFPTEHPKILRAMENCLSASKLEKITTELVECIESGNELRATQILFDAIDSCDTEESFSKEPAQ
jgi:FlaA1/EpsC-like NDP-sugar epimerase